MADIISPERRSALMSRIRGKDTKIELEVRKGLHALGLRYRLGGAGLPGRPDIVLSKHRTVVLVHGCFWHKHDCELFRMPRTRVDFWQKKLENNAVRDKRTIQELVSLGWHVEIIWECQLRGHTAHDRAITIENLARRIISNAELTRTSNRPRHMHGT